MVIKKKIGSKKVMRKKKRPIKKVVEGKASVETSSSTDPKGIGRRKTMHKRVSFEVDPAYVSVKKGRTINLGNYESARFDVSVMLPCYIEDVEKTEAELDTLTMAMLDAEVAAFNTDGDTDESPATDEDWEDD